MANNKQRYVNTRFWNDGYVSELDPLEKLLFIYFLTNEHTNISGIYEVPMKIIGIETGIDTTMIPKILPRFKDKINYVEGKVVIKNFIKHQETGSDLVKKGIINCLKDLDIKFLKSVVKQGLYELPRYYTDTLSIQYTKVSNYSNSNLDLDSNSIAKAKKPPTVKEKTEFNPQGAELIKSFEVINASAKKMYGNTTQRTACDFLIKEYGFERIKGIIENTLPKTNSISYLPSITTPSQLVDKYASLESGLKKLKGKKDHEELKKTKVIF